MTEIYIVIEVVEYEGSSILACYNNMLAASQHVAIKEKEDTSEYSELSYYVNTQTVYNCREELILTNLITGTNT